MRSECLWKLHFRWEKFAASFIRSWSRLCKHVLFVGAMLRAARYLLKLISRGWLQGTKGAIRGDSILEVGPRLTLVGERPSARRARRDAHAGMIWLSSYRALPSPSPSFHLFTHPSANAQVSKTRTEFGSSVYVSRLIVRNALTTNRPVGIGHGRLRLVGKKPQDGVLKQANPIIPPGANLVLAHLTHGNPKLRSESNPFQHRCLRKKS